MHARPAGSWPADAAKEALLKAERAALRRANFAASGLRAWQGSVATEGRCGRLLFAPREKRPATFLGRLWILG